MRLLPDGDALLLRRRPALALHWRGRTWSLELSTGGIGFLVFELRAQMLDKAAAALPTGWNTAIRPTPPRFVGGRC
jgi:hypothetical protein